ncbi:putative bifunctional diguanylate cyclase/phosphodiesterase [Rhodobacter maris]|uniref:Diguanylate cyclase (GGDEF)-like protein n=1 Tax=Rhodobacter maris TaxID=446682 RepID=A0A285RG85_9RHOB|nr:GGDEF domain-containing phosphodiesterase [Rhodobacter maris]SOB93133.1 diguanylate cyclase (GGDEF)-like protein [Rhodobacter maris]
MGTHSRPRDLVPRACARSGSDLLGWRLCAGAEGLSVVLQGEPSEPPMPLASFAEAFIAADQPRVIAFLEAQAARVPHLALWPGSGGAGRRTGGPRAPLSGPPVASLQGRMHWDLAGDEVVLTSLEVGAADPPGCGWLLRLDTAFAVARGALERIAVTPAQCFSITYPERRLEVSAPWKARLGYEADDLPDFSLDDWAQLSHPDDIAAFDRADAQARLRAGETVQILSRLRHRNGEWISVLSHSRAVRWRVTGELSRVIGCDIEISAVSLLEDASIEASLARERDRLAHLLDVLPTGKIVLDSAGQVVFCNPEAGTLLGLGLKESVGLRLGDLLAPEEGREELEEALGEPDSFSQLRVHRRRASKRQVLQLDIAPLPDPSFRSRQLVSLSDVTQLFDLQRQLEYSIENARFIATHDLMTGLPDRFLLMRRLEESVRRARVLGQPIAVLALEFDNYRLIHDTLGHETAGQLIKLAAKRLETGLPEGAVLARVNEGEFVILLPGTEGCAAEARGWELVRAFTRPLHLPQRQFFLTASVGVSLFPRDGEGAEALMRTADMAMHQSQARGRNTVTRFSPELGAEFERRSAVAQALHRALEAGRFELHLQPKFEVVAEPTLRHWTVAGVTVRLAGAEALLRLTDAELGAVSPGEFIPVAEVDGLVCAIDRDVMRLAGAMLTGWASRGLSLPVAVNINAATLDDPQRADLARELARAGLAPHQVIIELTETGIAQPIAARQRNLRQLEAAGYRISVDDFGTGQSALGALQDLPVTELKIDRSFVSALDGPEPERALAIVRAILAMAQALGLKAIAEGVETEAQFEILRGAGCTLMQGFLLGRPVDLAQFEALYLQPEPVPCAPALATSCEEERP